MSHLTQQTARTFDLHGVRFTSFAGTAAGAHELAAWRADFPAQTPGQPHTMSAEEVLLVLSGELHLEVGDDAFTVGAGEAALVPAGAALRVSTGAHAASAWVTTRLGMRATMAAGDELAPPWAQ